MTAGVTGLVPFTVRLTRARFAARNGESLLYGASVLAATVSSGVAFTVAGGTWMFYERWAHPTGTLALLAQDPTFRVLLGSYVALAALACALVVPSLVSLCAAGAQLGARGRERRLAALRLLGLSSGDVTRMASIDALAQTTLGTLLGFLVYRLTLPLWGNLRFEATPIDPGEMVLPWTYAVALAVVLVGLGFGASAWGLHQVRVSPLGVSRRVNSPAVRAWRLVALVVVVAVAGLVMTFLPSGAQAMGRALFIAAGVVAAVLAAVNLAGPFLMQLLARVLLVVPSPTVVTAARRVVASPRATWARVSTLGVLAFIGGYLANMPFAYDAANAHSDAEASFMREAGGDFTRGAIITLAFGFVLTATSLLITQASATIERAEQSRALHRMGVPDGFATRVMWVETFAPLVVGTVLGAGLGLLFAAPMARQIRESGLDAHDSGLVPMLAVLLGGLLVAATALAATHPLQRRILAVDERRND
ncbi:FtsX-like permease family protein [Mobilicoccus pelagius]|uniref:ABC3 transporter permease C-terminal domain-containing protein n=1 Tax=Mobilicoccus pelagius NBRC 104925 TaxID=1089455 RepID=H5UW40_9MICO|nr:FtsX-like permease family protein [Mobilicoccus pelagius]GAB49948.1 hypothetical protein MOPEL_135_01860 [Mobilicoccus pelagius NBRC 104925]